MSEKWSASCPPQPAPIRETNVRASLLTMLGLKKVSDQIDELGLFYLIGRAYYAGARSLRQVAKMLRAPAAEDLAERVGESLPKSLRAIHRAIAVLEDVLGEQLVNRPGEGLGYDGLTEVGERLWGQTAKFVQEFWAEGAGSRGGH